MSLENEFAKRKLPKKDSGLWLLSFSDMSLLMMCLFIMLYSFSIINQKKFDNVRSAMKKDVETKSNLQEMSDQLLQEIKKQKLDATVLFDADGVTLELKDKIVFPSGSAHLAQDFRSVTDRLMTVIANAPTRYKISFEGHTDDEPVGGNADFKSNWELSAARGLSLLRELNRRGVPEERMAVIAYAHTRPKVSYDGKSGNDLRAARDANRRVVIRIQ